MFVEIVGAIESIGIQPVGTKVGSRGIRRPDGAIIVRCRKSIVLEQSIPFVERREGVESRLEQDNVASVVNNKTT